MIEANWQNFCGFSWVWKNYNHLKYILAENCQAKGVNYVTSARGFLVSCCGSSHINIKLPNLLSHLQSPYTKVLLWSLYRKQTLAGLVAQFDSLSAVKNGSSIITLKSSSMNLSNENIHTPCFQIIGILIHILSWRQQKQQCLFSLTNFLK